jgi:hypothetical protein
MTLTATQNPNTKSIMRRVYAIWFLKRATRPALMRFYIFLMAVVEIAQLVSVKDVVANASVYDAPHMATYFGQSLLSTELVVQGVLALIVVGGIFVIRDTFVRRELFLSNTQQVTT